MSGMDAAANEYADNLKIAERFFLKSSRSGFLFGVCNDELVQREVNRTLQFLLQGKGKLLHVHTWQKGDDAPPPLEQLRLLKKSLPNLGGLILDGVDSALLQHPDLLVQLNFGREALSELSLPLFFWLSTRTLQRISNEAIDLYNQRVGANLYFEQAAETTDTDNTLRRYVAQETVRSNENIRYLEARMKLLQQQLDEAEQQQRDVAMIADEIVSDLLSVYVKIPGTVPLIQGLLARYLSSFNLENPAHCRILASAFEYIGDIGEACRFYEKTLVSYRDLAHTNPQSYLSDVARTLNNLANLQQRKNDYAGAEEGYRKALQIRRDLARTNPQSYLPDVATTLNNLAVLQSAKNDYAGAEEGYREALGIYRDLANTNQQSYLLDIARTLNNLANLQQAKNDYAGAEEGCREALGIYRDLAHTNPQTYLPYVAGTLNNLANLQQAKNDYAGAKQSYREALQIVRDLAKTNPQSYLPDVAMTLINLGWFYLKALPDKQQSLEHISEALRIILPLTETLPYTQQYAASALNLLKAWGIDPEEFIKQLSVHE